jgi:D,D-heptose 1,7-bisphosphate phosphatase
MRSTSAATTSITQAVILAGGLGARLGELTKDVPKPLLPVAGRPFIDYVIANLARYGIEDIVLSTGYLSHAFDTFLAGRTWLGPYGNPVGVRNLVESQPAGTAGALKLHGAELDERFLLLNGDTFFDCDLAEVLSTAERLAPGEALLAVREVPDAGRYGSIRLDGNRITSFQEKSTEGRRLINSGVAALTPECLSPVHALPCSIERDIYPALASTGRLKGIVQTGYFIDIGLPEILARAQTEMLVRLKKPALFLDRDGVLNRDAGYVHRAEDFEWLPGAIDAIKTARNAGMLVIVVTNQAGVAHGYYDEAAIERLHRHINAELRHYGTWIDAFYYCPHHLEGVVPEYRQVHIDRKPGPGMLLRAFTDLNIDKAYSFLIGDKESDLEAAKAAGIPGYIIAEGQLLPLVRSLVPSSNTETMQQGVT